MNEDDGGSEQVMGMLQTLGGMAGLASADLPARISKTWAETAAILIKLVEPHVLGVTDGKPQVQILMDERNEERVYNLIDFCLERIELIAATQPRVAAAKEEEEES